MLSDFVDLQKQGKPLSDIVAELSDKYGYDLKGAVAQGVPQNKILEDLIKAKPTATGILSIPGALLRGGAKGIYADIPEMTGKALQATGIPGVSQVGKYIRGLGEKAGETLEYETPKMSALPRIFSQAGEMLAPSAFGGAVGGAAGRALGIAKGLEGAQLGEAVAKGAALGGGTLFGASQGREAYENAKKANLPEATSLLNGVTQGLMEFGGEYLGTKYLAKLFGLGGKEVTGITKKIAEKLGIRSGLVKLGMEAIGVEAGTEVAQQFGEELTGALLKASPKSMKQVITDSLSVIPPTVIMTALTGVGGGIQQKLTGAKQKETPSKVVTKEKKSLVPGAVAPKAPLALPQFLTTPGEATSEPGTPLENPPVPFQPAGLPAVQNTEGKADEQFIISGFKNLGTSFRSLRNAAKDRLSILTSMLEKSPQFQETAPFHAQKIQNQVHEDAKKVQPKLRSWEKKVAAFKDDDASRAKADTIVDDVIQQTPYMTNDQLARTKKLLSDIGKKAKHERASALSDEMPTTSMAYLTGFKNYIENQPIQGQEPKGGYQPPKQIEAPPHPDIDAIIHSAPIREAFEASGVKKINFDESIEAPQMSGDTLLVNPYSPNLKQDIAMSVGQQAYGKLKPRDQDIFDELISKQPKNRMSPLVREAVKSDDLATAYAGVLASKNKPWARMLLDAFDTERGKPSFSQMLQEGLKWKAAAKQAEAVYGSNQRAIDKHRNLASVENLTKFLADKFKTDAETAYDVASYITTRNLSPTGEVPMAQYSQEPWAKAALEYTAPAKGARAPGIATHAMMVKGEKGLKFIKLTKETKKYYYWKNEAGESGRIAKSKVSSLRAIEKVKIPPPEKMTEAELANLEAAFREEKKGPPRPTTPLTTIDVALDSIRYFLVNHISGSGVTTLRQAIQNLEEKLKLKKYSDKEFGDDLKYVREKLVIKNKGASGKNPVDTRLIGAINYVDDLLVDPEFKDKLTRVGAIINTFNNLLSPEGKSTVQEEALTKAEGQYQYLKFPSTQRLFDELASYRTYLDSFFNDFVSAVSTAGVRGHGVLQQGFMIKDIEMEKEGDFITALYSHSRGDEDPKFVIVQKRGQQPKIVPYSALTGAWRLNEADKKARDDKLGGVSFLDAKEGKQYTSVARKAIRKGIPNILKEEFLLSPNLSQFFTGLAFEKAKKAGIKHETTLKETTKAPVVSGKVKGSSESILKEITGIQTSIAGYNHALSLDEISPKIGDNMKGFLQKKIERHIEYILGNRVKVFLGTPDEIAHQLGKVGVTSENFTKLMRGGSETLRKQYAGLPLDVVIRDRLNGFTINMNGLFSWVFLNTERSKSVDVLRTSFHEIMEALHRAGRPGYLTTEEINLLHEEYKDARYPNEALADAFADYMMDEEGFTAKNPSMVARIFRKIGLFIKRIRNYIKGLGFKTSQDIFNTLASGEARITSEAAPEEVPTVYESLAASMKDDPNIRFDSKTKMENLTDWYQAIRKGFLDTAKNPYLGKFAKWVVPPQWHSHPVIRSIFGIVESSSEDSWEAISDLLEPVIPPLRDLKKASPEKYKALVTAVIASDKVDVAFDDETLKADFGMDTETIAHYHALKETYDNVLDKFFDNTRKTLVHTLSNQYEDQIRTNVLGEPYPELDATLKDIQEGFINGSMFEAIANRQESLISDYEMEKKIPKASNKIRGDMLRRAVSEQMKTFSFPNDEVEAHVNEYVTELMRATIPLERQREQYKSGFYFPRIRPAGDFAVKVMSAQREEDPETGEVTTVWRETDRYHTNPGALTKQNIEKHKVIQREAKKYGDRVVVVDGPEEFQRIKDTLLPSNVVVFSERIIRTPNTLFEGITNRSIMNYLSYLTTKLQETKNYNHEEFKEMIKVLHNELDEDLKARSFARSRWIKRQSGQVDIEALLSGADEWGNVVGGYDTDILNVTRSYTIAEMRHIARNDAVDTINTFINNEAIKKEILGDENLYDWYKRYVDGVLSPDTPLMRYSRAAKSVISLWYLGGRISSAAIQLTQSYVTGAPELAIFENATSDDLLGYRGQSLPLKEVSKHLVRQGQAAKRISKALSDIVAGRLTDEEKDALGKGIRSKVLQSQFINSLIELDDRVLGRTFTPIVNLGMKFFQYAEQKSREVGYIAAMRLAKEKGLSNEEALDFATNYTNTAFHIYASTNKPLFATGKSGMAVLSSIPLALKGYQINYLGWIYKAFKNEYGKSYADKAIFSSMYMAMLGGMWAIPLLGDIFDILSSYMGIPLRKKIQNNITSNVKAQKALEFGLPAAFLGVDMSGSARLDLIPTEWSLTGIVDNLLGVWTSAGKKLSRAKVAYDSDQYVRTMESLAPVAVENVIKALRYGVGKQEMRTLYGRTVLDEQGKPVKPSMSDSALMLLGFRPVDLSQIASVYRATRTIENYWKVKHDRIFIKVKASKDWKELSKVLSTDVNEYNEGVAKYGGAIPFITPRGILSALKNSKGKPSRLIQYVQ